MFDRLGNYLAAIFAALALSWLALIMALSASQERGRWLREGCNTPDDCARMAAYMKRRNEAP